MNEMPLDKQLDINIDKKRMDKKVRALENKWNDKEKKHVFTRKMKAQIKKRATEMEKSLFGR